MNIPVEIKNWKKEKDTKFDFLRVIRGKYTEFNRGAVAGIDPGVNFGITFIVDNEIVITNGHLPDETKPKGWEYGVIAYEFTRELVSYLFPKHRGFAVVEGAAYNKKQGQVGLESVRFGYYLGLLHSAYNATVKPPATIRLGVFGKGTIQAGEIWPLLNDNAADSLAIALYALKLKKEQDEN